jgi:hypothetical protein
MTLALREGKLVIDLGEVQSEARPHIDANGAITEYLFTDPPLGSFPPEFSLALTQGADGQPRPELTILAAPGDTDQVYSFEPV